MFQFGVSKRLSLQQAHANLAHDASIVVLDVRTSSEYFGNGHIKKAINIDVDTIESKVQSVITKKDTTIYVICRSGSRSAMACSILKKLGYTNIFDLGGIANWPAQLEYK